MKKWMLVFLLPLLLTGCAALLERSYSVVEPYTDRYWDSGAEDTLRVETYQDLVNSLLILVEQRTEEAVIRCYGDANAYMTVSSACREVQKETAPGSYLLSDLTFTFVDGDGADYCTLTCRMTYRLDTEDPETILTLSDSQSLVDLLRMSVREDLKKLTAQFVRDTPRQEVTDAVESFWQELCRGEEEESPDAPEDEPPEDGEEGQTGEPAEDGPLEDGEEEQLDILKTNEENVEEPGGDGLEEPLGDEDPEEEPPSEEYPPCPWTVRFYPDLEETEIVEILLAPTRPYYYST